MKVLLSSLTLIGVCAGCGARTPITMGSLPPQISSDEAAKSLPPPPVSLGLDPFYAKYLDADGIPIVSSSRVSDRALWAAREIVLKMLCTRPDLGQEMARHHVRVAIIGSHERSTEIPEHRDLYEAFPETDWDQRTRGVGATIERPACSIGEENLLGLPGDRYRGEGILIHEFSHSMVQTGLDFVDPNFDSSLRAAYDHAMKTGLWKNTYSATNADEYWAEGVQAWFGAAVYADPPNGVHNSITTRDRLRRYDPQLAALIATVFPDDAWRYHYAAAVTYSGQVLEFVISGTRTKGRAA